VQDQQWGPALPELLVPGTVRCAQKNILDSQKLMPANGRTILIYLLTGFTLAVAAILTR
jgi:hypothetical protein